MGDQGEMWPWPEACPPSFPTPGSTDATLFAHKRTPQATQALSMPYHCEHVSLLSSLSLEPWSREHSSVIRKKEMATCPGVRRGLFRQEITGS